MVGAEPSSDRGAVVLMVFCFRCECNPDAVSKLTYFMLNLQPKSDVDIHKRDVPASAQFINEKLGFDVDFLDGTPPFYGAVSRGVRSIDKGSAVPSERNG